MTWAPPRWPWWKPKTLWDDDDSVCSWPLPCFCVDTGLAYVLGVDSKLIARRWAEHIVQVLERASDDLDNSWKCHVCGQWRPDEAISVRSHQHTLATATASCNVRYCNDRRACVAGSLDKCWFGKVADAFGNVAG